MHTADLWLWSITLGLCLAGLLIYRLSRATDNAPPPLSKKRSPKPLKPRPADDCARCRTTCHPLPPLLPSDPPPRPWASIKSPRGRKKSISTEGYACRNPTCAYRFITDAYHHALVADGRHGQDRIQDFRCQACGQKFSARRGTALYRLRTSSERVSLALALVAESCALNTVQRVFGIRETTLRLWLTRAGLHAQRLHVHFSQSLVRTHIQLDELCTTARQCEHDLWLWVALDALTKFIPAFVLGPRTQDLAHQLVPQVRQTLDSASLPVFSSDGLKLYFYALTAHFGHWGQPTGTATRVWQAHPNSLYAQVNQIHRRRRLLRVAHHRLCGTLETFTARLQTLGLSGRIQTAFIERVNLTLRRSLAALARRSWSLAQLPGELTLQLECWRAYYHFVRPHQAWRLTLEVPRLTAGQRTPQRYQPQTPAMAVGLTSRSGSVQEVLSFPLPR